MKRSFVFKTTAILLIPFFLTCSQNENDTFVDFRDGKRYRFIKMGSLLWMAENLDYKTGDSLNSWCYDNEDSNCKKYGRLYDWKAAMNACPEEWYLPSYDEWQDLIRVVEGKGFAFKDLKSEAGWNDYKDGKSGNGTDDFVFSMLPGGCRDYDGRFSAAGNCGHWWSSTEWISAKKDEDGGYHYRGMCTGSDGCGAIENHGSGKKGYSVRCVREKDVSKEEEMERQALGFSTVSVSFRQKECHSGCYKRNKDPCKHWYPDCGEWGGGGRYRERTYIITSNFSIVKTATSVFAKYSLVTSNSTKLIEHQQFEAELTTEEWRDFIKDLYGCDFEEWQKFKGPGIGIQATSGEWELFIHFSDREKLGYSGYKKYPPNWGKFRKIMSDMEWKVKRRAGDK
jgi:uncharacterized protein (TIGR02145 family)